MKDDRDRAYAQERRWAAAPSAGDTTERTSRMADGRYLQRRPGPLPSHPLRGQLPAVRLLASGRVFRAILEIAAHAEAVRRLIPDSDLAGAIQRLVAVLVSAAHEAASLHCNVDTATAAAVWGVPPDNVRRLCREGKIEGAFKLGGEWCIPIDVLQKPLPS